MGIGAGWGPNRVEFRIESYSSVMVDSAKELEQAELRLAKAQEALDQVKKVLEAAEQAQAAADRAREAADHAHEAVRRVNMVLPVVAVGLGVVILLSRRRHHS